MKCTNCGFEFEEGIFCPECGMKYEENTESEMDKEQKLYEENREQEVQGKKIPWYLSVLFILLIYWWTISIYGIPGIILGIIRWKKYGLEKKTKILFVGLILLAVLIAMLPTESSESENGNTTVDKVEEQKETSEKREVDVNEKKEKDGVEDVYAETILVYADALIRIEYEKNAVAYNDDVILYVDGEEIGKMDAGEESAFEVILDVGTHVIQAKSDTLLRNNNSNKLEFDVKAGFQEVHFFLEEGFWGLKISSEK